MAQYDANQATTTSSTVEDFSVSPVALDASNDYGDTTYDFPNATKYLGYYKKIPELKKAVDNLAIWTVGKGLECDSITQTTIDHVRGWGEDSFQSILENLIVVKKIVGDSFAEIIEEKGILINLKPISPERMRIVVGKNGLIKYYETKTASGWKKLAQDKVLHLCNDRVADEIHGTSVIEACQWVIDARNEALADERKIKHRELAMGVLYVDTDDQTKISRIKDQYADAVKNGEVLVLPKDRLAWIAYLENFFYQAVGIPRVIASSQEYTEAASKVGYMTFEPVYTREQTLLEQDIWNKLYLKVKFNRPPSLSGVVQESEAKNTGQMGFQPNEVTATAGRVE
jgi:hypothetical protein